MLHAFLGGQVRRWHTKPHLVRQQNVAEHSWGVATWISILHPDPSARLLKAAIHHDLGEEQIGDIPYYAKRASPEAAEMLFRLEQSILVGMGLQSEAGLTEEELSWLHGADLFDAWLFLLQHAILGNYYMQGDLNKTTREIRSRKEERRIPDAIADTMEQVRSVYAHIKIW